MGAAKYKVIAIKFWNRHLSYRHKYLELALS
jgi:hypothetical protein